MGRSSFALAAYFERNIHDAHSTLYTLDASFDSSHRHDFSVPLGDWQTMSIRKHKQVDCLFKNEKKINKNNPISQFES